MTFDWFALDLPEHVCAEVDGIPTVTVPDGLVQAAESVDRKRLRTGFDDAVRRDLATGREVEQAVRRLDGVLEGAGIVGKLIASGTLQLESEGERELGNLFGPEDPQPLWQVWIGGYRVDALFAEARLVLEYHGKRHHRSEQDRRADRARAAKLRADHDIEIIEVTAADLANPVALRERILGRRAERLRAGTSPLRTIRWPSGDPGGDPLWYPLCLRVTRPAASEEMPPEASHATVGSAVGCCGGTRTGVCDGSLALKSAQPDPNRQM